MTEDGIDRGDVVEEIWPYDGPHSAESVQTAAGALSDLVRYLNNATQPGTARHTLAQANSIGSVVSSVKAAVYGLDQLVEQLSAAARAQAARSDVYDARAENPEERHNEGMQKALELAETLNELRPWIVLWDGIRPVGGLAAELERAHTVSARLGNDPDANSGHDIPEEEENT